MLEAGVARSRVGHRRDLRERLRLPGLARRPDVLRRSRRPRRTSSTASDAFHRELGERWRRRRCSRSWPRDGRTFRELDRWRAADVIELSTGRPSRAHPAAGHDRQPRRSRPRCGPVRPTRSARIPSGSPSGCALGGARARPHVPRGARRRRRLASPDLRRRRSSACAASRRRCSIARLSAERPVVILSGNSIEHALLALAAMYAACRTRRSRRPTRCSSQRPPHARRRLRDAMRPGLVFAADGAAFERALASLSLRPTSRSSRASPLRTAAQTSVRRARRHRRDRGGRRRARACRPGHDREGAVHVGIDRRPEGRHQHAADAVREPGADPQRAWRFSPTSRRCCATGCRGTTPSAATTTSASCSTTAARSTSTTARRRRRGFDTTVAQPARDRRPPRTSTCRAATRCCCRRCAAMPILRARSSAGCSMLFYAAAGLRQEVCGRASQRARRRGAAASAFRGSPASARPRPRRSRCAPGRWPRRSPARIGLPAPGVELKLAPVGAKLEARVRGPNITPGYWRDRS